MTTASMEIKVERALLKSKPLTAGELAARANLSGVDGSGRPIARALARLVDRGVAARHGRHPTSRQQRYTRAA